MAKRQIMPLETGRIRLRLLEERDLARTLAWRNQDHIRRWFFYSEPLTPEQHAGWFQRYRNRDDDFVFIIEEAGEAPRPIGQVAIYNVDWSGGSAEFGRLMIGEADAGGRGLAREATGAAVTLAFEQLGLRELYLQVIPSNLPAIKVYEACGFEAAGETEDALRMTRRADGSRRVGQASLTSAGPP
jgi:RimJ/RimL family protein N-acetyltransferase